MPSKFVRLKCDEVDIAINLERVTHVMKTSDIVSIYFAGDNDFLKLRELAAEDFWRCIAGSSLCIHREQHKSQSDGALAKPQTNADWNAVNPAQQSSTADRPN